jgi:16S rRNA U516 pseudouridylate synthase RsuA-like enzyme
VEDHHQHQHHHLLYPKHHVHLKYQVAVEKMPMFEDDVQQQVPGVVPFLPAHAVCKMVQQQHRKRC